MTRLQRGRAILIALAVALVALILTARCEAPGASEVPERGQAPLKSPEAVSAACTPQDAPSDAEAIHALRVRKAERLVATFAPHSGFLPYCETLVSTHERMEAEGGERARGFGGAWYWSLVYGTANFGLRVGGVAPGNCAGPMDVKRFPLVLDPIENIEWHCREMLSFYKRGVRGRSLCEHVYLPSNPKDWQVRNGKGRFERTDEIFRECLQRGYEVGKLP